MELRPHAAGPLLLLMVLIVECAPRVRRQETSEVWPRRIPASGRVSYRIFLPNGIYDFGYDTGGGEHQSFRQESRDGSGLVTGLYGYVEEDGSLRVVQYEADARGYRWSTATYRRVASVPKPRKPAKKADKPRRRQERRRPLIVGPIPVAPPQR